VKIRLVTKCGCTREVETNACVLYQVPFPDGSWRVFTWDSGTENARIFHESANFRISRSGKRKAWERP